MYEHLEIDKDQAILLKAQRDCTVALNQLSAFADAFTKEVSKRKRLLKSRYDSLDERLALASGNVQQPELEGTETGIEPDDDMLKLLNNPTDGIVSDG